LANRRSDSNHHLVGPFLSLIASFLFGLAIGLTERKMSDTPFASRAANLAPESPTSSVSWAAIIAGAFVASAFSLALLALGAGLGLVSISPWSGARLSATTFGILAAAWFIAVQLFSSGIGGYIAGRLRTRWVGAHTDEVFFRDTAHGLLVWAVGAVITASLLTSAVSSIAAGVVSTGSAAAQSAGNALSAPAAQAAGRVTSNVGDPRAYFTDMLFRTDHAMPADQSAPQAEVGRIFARALAAGDLPATDKSYVAQVVAARTGLSQADAEKRVSDIFDQAKSDGAAVADKAKAVADAARKTGVYVSLWAFISLLVGAFSASYMATIGGRVRDDLPMMG
jgi:hypothetical protein